MIKFDEVKKMWLGQAKPLRCIFLIYLQREQENKKIKEKLCCWLKMEYTSVICCNEDAH